MEETILHELQKLHLIKEEEEDICFTTQSRLELLEECSLSLFGRLLSDHKQNERALKNTLRAAWKLGSDLRIVDVGKDIMQFKFSFKYQMEWVEKSGPWNFENNLLLQSRWKKGLSTANITFTHTPFWVQIWGLPFEHMSEGVGKDIGGKFGEYLEIDKRSWQSDQAKFMRVRVNVQIDKPLRRGGYVKNTEGERFWITFKYERLPTFCFICGRMGHDDKHCEVVTNEQAADRQYFDWLKVGWNQNGNQSRAKTTTDSGGKTTADKGSVSASPHQTPDKSDFPTSGHRGKRSF